MNTIRNHRTAAQLVLGAAMAANLLVPPAASRAALYFYTDLNPSGFTGSQGASISGSQQVGQGSGTGFNAHALLWSGTASSVVDLHPSGFTTSFAYGTSGSQQVGSGYGPTIGSEFDALLWSGTPSSVDLPKPPPPRPIHHALLWSGTASSAVDLHPSGFISSFGLGISGSQQVGSGTTGFEFHALLWSGTASSVVDLHPSGFTNSSAYGISGSQQVGSGFGSATGFELHALLWSGTASSAVDLNPSGFTNSAAYGISGSQQVGNGVPAGGGIAHALLWSGTASSAVDLNPSGFDVSLGYGTSGSQQVGYGAGPATGDAFHALLWSGTASSVVDLQSFLSSDYSYSVAQGIDANGNVIGYAHHIPTGQDHAILWTVVPERVVLGNDPGQCGAVYNYSTGSTGGTCSPPSGSFFPVGSTTVTWTATNPARTFTFTVIVEDREPPMVACRPAPNPSGKKIPMAGKNPQSGQNPDGFYQLLAKDNCDPAPAIFVADSASSFVAGPFASGDIVKMTQSPGEPAFQNPGPLNVVAHIHLKGDALIYAVDASGNAAASVPCNTPPP